MTSEGMQPARQSPSPAALLAQITDLARSAWQRSMRAPSQSR